MDETKPLLTREEARKLARATKEQCAYRLIRKDIREITSEEIEDFPFSENIFENFYLSIPKHDEEIGLFLAKHKRPFDMPNEYSQSIEFRDLKPEVKITIIPRGIINSSKLEEDLKKSGELSLEELIKKSICELNRKYAPIITRGKHGQRSYRSKFAYEEILKDEKILNILLSYSQREPYFGFLRADYCHFLERDKKPGWWKPQPTKLIRTVPIIVIPNLTIEDLEKIEKKEKKILGLD